MRNPLRGAGAGIAGPAAGRAGAGAGTAAGSRAGAGEGILRKVPVTNRGFFIAENYPHTDTRSAIFANVAAVAPVGDAISHYDTTILSNQKS